MKYFFQIFFSGILPFGLFLLAGNVGDISMNSVNVLLKRLEIIGFLVVGVTSLFGYAYLVGKEITQNKKICYTLAQTICILTSANSFAYAWVVNKWIDIAQKCYSSNAAYTIDIFYSLIDLSSTVNKFLVVQFIFVVLFRRWIIPLHPSFRMNEPIGKILIKKGYITEEQLKEALEKQNEVKEKDDEN